MANSGQKREWFGLTSYAKGPQPLLPAGQFNSIPQGERREGFDIAQYLSSVPLPQPVHRTSRANASNCTGWRLSRVPIPPQGMPRTFLRAGAPQGLRAERLSRLLSASARLSARRRHRHDLFNCPVGQCPEKYPIEVRYEVRAPFRAPFRAQSSDISRSSKLFK